MPLRVSVELCDPASGPGHFALGHIRVEGERGVASTRDEGRNLILVLSLTLLLDGLCTLVDQGTSFDFIGTGSSFQLGFVRDRALVVTASQGKRHIGTMGDLELAGQVSTTARTLVRSPSCRRAPLRPISWMDTEPNTPTTPDVSLSDLMRSLDRLERCCARSRADRATDVSR